MSNNIKPDGLVVGKLVAAAGVMGAVLAGGGSGRMGQDKALVPLKGMPLIEHVLRTVQKVCKGVVIVGDNAEEYNLAGTTVVCDIYKKCGPLGGIHAALTHVRTSACCIVSCDTPFIRPQLLYYLVDAWSGTVAVPAMDGQMYPLCGVYGRKVLPLLEDFLKCGRRSVREFLQEARAKVVPITADLPFFAPTLFFNVDTPVDLREAERM